MAWTRQPMQQREHTPLSVNVISSMKIEQTNYAMPPNYAMPQLNRNKFTTKVISFQVKTFIL